MSIYERILELCKERNTNKTAVEAACGFSQNSINKWQNSYPSIDKVVLVADHFGVSLDYLLGRDTQSASSKSKVKPAHDRTRKETAEMIVQRYSNALGEEHFWLLVDLCAHIKYRDFVDLHATLCNAMIAKGYPVAEYLKKAHEYFVKGKIAESNISVTQAPTIAVQVKSSTALTDKLAEEYKYLFADDDFVKVAKVYASTKDAIVKGILVGYFLATAKANGVDISIVGY